MEKTAGVRVVQAELNDQPGVCLKLVGPLADVQAAADAAAAVARGIETAIVLDVIPHPA
jgi:microcompartment protein CcmL/EutN